MIYSLKTKLNFGKHKGKTLSQTLNTDPLYIQWCMNNVNEFNLDKKALEKVTDILFEIHKKENLRQQRFEI